MMRINEINRHIIEEKNRVFLDLCKKGCGSDCFYCYSKYKRIQQELLSENDIEQICNYILNTYQDKLKIISLCPNTEPFKSIESAKLVLQVIRFFEKHRCYIQISTKEVIPSFFIEDIKRINKRIYINISIPFLRSSKSVEPFAADAYDRLKNFHNLRNIHNVVLSLYIKPFFKKRGAATDYIRAIDEYKINKVCVGVKFDSEFEETCTSLYNTIVADSLYSSQLDDILAFMTELRENTVVKVFPSSICCFDGESSCSLRLYKYDDRLCSDCGRIRK